MGPSQTSNFAKIRFQLSLSLSVRVAERCTTNIWLVKLYKVYSLQDLYLVLYSGVMERGRSNNRDMYEI